MSSCQMQENFTGSLAATARKILWPRLSSSRVLYVRSKCRNRLHTYKKIEMERQCGDHNNQLYKKHVEAEQRTLG